MQKRGAVLGLGLLMQFWNFPAVAQNVELKPKEICLQIFNAFLPSGLIAETYTPHLSSFQHFRDQQFERRYFTFVTGSGGKPPLLEMRPDGKGTMPSLATLQALFDFRDDLESNGTLIAHYLNHTIQVTRKIQNVTDQLISNGILFFLTNMEHSATQIARDNGQEPTPQLLYMIIQNAPLP